jgi:hypothetical protein
LLLARPSRFVAGLLALLVLLTGCGGGDDPQPDSVTWRNITLDLPDGWWVYERTDTLLSISNVDLRPTDEPPAPPEGDVVSMSFTYRPGESPDDWRRFVADQDATLEADNRLVLDGEVPATQLVYRYVTNEVPTREMVVLIPSRSISVLSQPVPGPGDEDAPEVFLDWIDTFLEVLETAELGRPVLD